MCYNKYSGSCIPRTFQYFFIFFSSKKGLREQTKALFFVNNLKGEYMKVKAIVDWKIYRIKDKTINDYRQKGETWEVTKKRFEELSAFPHKLVEKVEIKDESISDNTGVEPRKTTKKSDRKHT